MSQPALAAVCASHPGVASGLRPCARCGRTFCPDCLIELAGLCCASCKDEQLRDLKSGTLAGRVVPWFSVGTGKFIAMSVASVGIYQVYWLYRQFKAEKDRTGDDSRPILRALVSFFFLPGLLRRIKTDAERASVVSSISPGGLTLAFIVLGLFGRAPWPVALISSLSVVPLLPARAAIERINAASAPEADRNHRLTGSNIAVIVVGALFHLLAIAGSILRHTN